MRRWEVFTCTALILLAAGVFMLTDKPVLGYAAGSSHDTVVRYRLQPSKSTFIVHAFRGGLFYFKGKNHLIAARDFGGEASLDLKALDPAYLQMTVKAASLEETSPVFTQQQKGIIKKELDELVLEAAKYPDITFKSTQVKGEIRNGQFALNIGGDMTLHGITRHVDIPATVTVDGETLRAKGEFRLNRKKFNVNATNAFHGFVRVKHTLKFTFDIIAERV